ncbi:hypothetical protein QTP88_026213 [Uroleucon formosanum]
MSSAGRNRFARVAWSRREGLPPPVGRLSNQNPFPLRGPDPASSGAVFNATPAVPQKGTNGRTRTHRPTHADSPARTAAPHTFSHTIGGRFHYTLLLLLYVYMYIPTYAA